MALTYKLEAKGKWRVSLEHKCSLGYQTWQWATHQNTNHNYTAFCSRDPFLLCYDADTFDSLFSCRKLAFLLQIKAVACKPRPGTTSELKLFQNMRQTAVQVLFITHYFTLPVISSYNFDTTEGKTIQHYSSNIKYYTCASQLLSSIPSLQQGPEKSEHLMDPLNNGSKQRGMFIQSGNCSLKCFAKHFAYCQHISKFQPKHTSWWWYIGSQKKSSIIKIIES